MPFASFSKIVIKSTRFSKYCDCSRGRGKQKEVMDLQTPCNACILVSQKPALPRQSFSRSKINIPFNRRKEKSELQAAVAVNGGVQSQSVPTHKITVHDRQRGVVHEFFVPEDQYILHTAEDQNITLPFACRHGTVLSSTNLLQNASQSMHGGGVL